MTTNPFQHVDIRVSDMRAALAFYSKLLPALGLEHRESSSEWEVFYGPGNRPFATFYSLIEEIDHRPNRNRIAFSASSRAEVDRLGAIIREAGAGNISGPRVCSEYSENYYAVFFEDPTGNCLEICYR